MGRDEQSNTNRKQNKQTTSKQKFQVQEQWNFSLSLSSDVTPPASSPGAHI
jgi:hypothetical protein